ncbi:MAG: PAS domain S-box protein [Nitrospirae bacterium]|nr:PAS domain S-box protein [Nitrospirota bacterium]MCL5286078.1 PAS domain S-box protein [Nitrospirota bacterium]
MRTAGEAGRKRRKLFLSAATAFVGAALLGTGFYLVFLFLHLSREKQGLENRIMAEARIIYGIEGSDPAFLLLPSLERGGKTSPALLLGWVQQVRSVLRSLPTIPFPWTPSDLRMIDRLDRLYGQFFREMLASPTGQGASLPATVREILTIRQALSLKVDRSRHRLEGKSRGLERALSRVEAGFFGVGLVSFGLLSYVVLSQRATRRLLKAVSSSESFLNTLIEAVPAALYLKDAEGRWLKVNRAGLDLFDLFGKPWQNRTDIELSREHPFYREALETCRARDLDAWKSGKSTVAIESVPQKDGRLLQLETTKVPVWNPDGSPLGLVVSAYDLTERLHVQEELRAASMYTRNLIEASLDPLVTISAEGKITDLNEATVLVTGVPRSRLVGSDFSGYFTEPDKAREGYREAFEKGFVTGYPLSIRHISGKVTKVLFNASLYKDESGKVAGLFAAARDITELKEAEDRILELNRDLERRVDERTEQLKTAVKDLEGFSYSVSHDLRTPLRAIDGFSRILLDEYSSTLDDEGKRLLNVVRENTKRMGQLIDDILQFSRAGRMEITFSEIDMEGLAREVFEELKNSFIGTSRVKIEIAPLPPVRGDRAMMRQVFVNLLSNAIKFSRDRDPAMIFVGASRTDEGIVYHVKDNGVGFDMRYADKLFGVFQRLHGETEFEGTGIGLAIVKRIVLRHGGRVWAESAVGQGATLSFSLPDKESFHE